MESFKIVFFALALACLANVIAAQGAGSRPSECGKWRSGDINCDFTCSGNGWELDCDTDSPSDADSSSSITCKVDQDGQPDSADVYFTCSYSSGQVSNLSLLNIIEALFRILVSSTVTLLIPLLCF